MKVKIELALRTREVYQLFGRRMDENRLFIDAILHKFSIVLNACRRDVPDSLVLLNEMQQKIIHLTQHMANETKRFESLLTLKKSTLNSTINYVVQYQPVIIATNRLSLLLIEFIQAHDTLVAILKLLHLAGCFELDSDCLNNIKRYQKMANQMLSELVLTSVGMK